MRRLIYAINMTIDGCCDHTKVVGDEAIHDYFAHLIRGVDVLLYGRKTYQLMVPFWPDLARNHSGQPRSMIEFARAFDSVGQVVVFSRSLDEAVGGKTRILRANLADEILKLKQAEGRPILAGGVTLASQLMELGLVDEYQFVIHPVLAGEGRRLLEGANLQERLQLKLAESSSLGSGCVALRYLRQGG
jgi:dihydrofolate reductase